MKFIKGAGNFRLIWIQKYFGGWGGGGSDPLPSTDLLSLYDNPPPPSPTTFVGWGGNLTKQWPAIHQSAEGAHPTDHDWMQSANECR